MLALAAAGISNVMSASHAHACWDDAAARYQVNGELLYAIARTESFARPSAVVKTRQLPRRPPGSSVQRVTP